MAHQQPSTGYRQTHLGQQGLTLIEVLITLTILAVMGVIALGAFRLGHRSWERAERRAAAEQRIRIIYGMLAQELASLQPVTVQADGKTMMAFKGSREHVLFHSGPDAYVASPYTGMVRGVSIFVEQGKGLVVQESYPLVEGRASFDPEGTVKVVDPHVTRIRFRYLARSLPEQDGPQWVEAWDPVEVSESTGRPVRIQAAGRRRAETAEGRGLPLAVEVRLALADEGAERELDFLFPIPIAQGL